MSSERIGFRRKLIGGFDRRDVSAELTRLAGERNKYRKQAEELGSRVSSLESDLELIKSDQLLTSEAEDKAMQALELMQEIADAYDAAIKGICASAEECRHQADDLSQQLQQMVELIRSTEDKLSEMQEKPAQQK